MIDDADSQRRIDICDENCDWPLRSGVAFSVQGSGPVHPS